MQGNGLYRIETYSRVKRDLKRLDKRLQEQILEEHYPNIEADPYRAYSLSHEFKGLWSYHISYRRSNYRIVYEIYPQDRIVLVIMIGSREGFYKALRRRIKGARQ
ncbi:MAG: type II toxin-antitoxin system mRNA interferase toxin, RelE/StbE family [Candidatus Bipolaricaulota bacterium]|nr:type II toxin-antitoxin system mRNA interferase toxin, RelE/StbE family [Candidatus Bipolaricaulota bacterium]